MYSIRDCCEYFAGGLVKAAQSWGQKQMTEIYVIEIPISEITLGDFENCEPLKKV